MEDTRRRVRWPVRARDLIGRPVRLGAVEVGTVSDVIANAGLGHLLGFEVDAGDAYARFLPWVGAQIESDHVVVRSPYSLLSLSDLSLYAEHGVRLSARLAEGEPRDLLVDRHGDVAAALFEDGARRRRRLQAVRGPQADATDADREAERAAATPSSSSVQRRAKRSMP